MILRRLSKDQVTNNRQTQQEQKKVVIEQLIPKRGQNLYELDLQSDKIKTIDWHTADTIHYTCKNNINIIHNKIKARNGCIYCLAINEKNAIRKFIKMIDNAKRETN